MSSSDAHRPPSVDRLVRHIRDRVGDRDPDAVVRAARSVISAQRQFLAGEAGDSTIDALGDAVIDELRKLDGFPIAGIAPVINATGVIIHTNLGRASWPDAAIRAAAIAAADPMLLELDESTGRRGRRLGPLDALLASLTGAEDGLIVNNNAAALALAVRLAGRGRRVAVSRGEMIEIGGGARIPEIISRSGVKLVEVGTTNRTRVDDFGEALEAGVRVVLRVHRSNFRQEGFVEDPSFAELATMVHKYGGILIDDLGSGALIDTAPFGLAHEPMPRERIQAGADVVMFSGDKLVGGPQAGLIAGRADLLAGMRRDPMHRVLRPDKVIAIAVGATLALYASGRATQDIPVWRMLAATPDDLRRRAELIVAGNDSPVQNVTQTESAVGGGAAPGQLLRSFGIAISARRTDEVLARLRHSRPRVIARIEHETVMLDLRSVDPKWDRTLAATLRALVLER